jgi:alpha-ribazole phosphatase/probable phosphoglycerate mutase
MIWALPPRVTRLVLVRHGEPEAESRGRCYGRLDVGLSDLGRAQAERAAWFLADARLAAIYTSPRRRAVETARPIAAARNLELRERDELREIDFGEIEGLSYDEVRAQRPALYEAWMTRPTTVTFPGGEGFADLRRRVLAVARDLRRACAGAALAVVAHGGVIRALLADALRVADEDIFRIDQSHGAVSVVDYLEDTAIVRLLNHVP